MTLSLEFKQNLSKYSSKQNIILNIQFVTYIDNCAYYSQFTYHWT